MSGPDASNPFATRFVRPDAATYLPLQTPPVEELAQRFREVARRAQIVGPHGVGKSTLLAALVRELRDEGEDVQAMTLHLGDRRLPAEFEKSLAWSRDSIVVIDGAEQLSWLRRRALVSKATKSGAGLLLTTHADLGLPTLCELVPREQDAVAVARRLDPHGVVSDDDVRAAFARRKGDLRETLFDLFDLYRTRTLEAPPPVPKSDGPDREEIADRSDFAGE